GGLWNASPPQGKSKNTPRFDSVRHAVCRAGRSDTPSSPYSGAESCPIVLVQTKGASRAQTPSVLRFRQMTVDAPVGKRTHRNSEFHLLPDREARRDRGSPQMGAG